MRTCGGSGFRFVLCCSFLSVLLTACGDGGGSASAQADAPLPSQPGIAPPETPGSADGNQAPTITGTAKTTVAAGQAYQFTPSASDPDEDEITFTIANKPGWASFVASTGELTGTPGEKDVGAYPDIEIAATDGKAVSALPTFSITVAAADGAGGADGGSAEAGAVTVSWVAPTENSDGSPLSDLAGYKIHYGTESQSYTEVISVDNPGLTRYVIDSLPAGRLYLAMTAYNSAGAESELSPEVSVTLN